MKCLQLTSFLVASALAGVAHAEEFPPPFGVWRNAKNSVHIAIHPCSETICGKVVWASPKAKADVRESTDSLVGTELLKDFRHDRNGKWRGKVFVPDMKQTFYGTISIMAPNRLKARGCLLAGIFCKTKIWLRVE